MAFAALSVLALIERTGRLRWPRAASIPYLWTLFLVFTVAEFVSFRIAIWILALLCFAALKEYFTIIDVRWQDRWAILGGYLSIPFMITFIQIDWYGMFIISIPVYAFLVIPFLVALGGGEAEGTVFSIGAIDFGLFLLVYCTGHLGYLALRSTWWAILLVVAVLICDLVASSKPGSDRPGLIRTSLRHLAAVPLTVILAWLLSRWTGIPVVHSVVLGFLIPALVAIGRYTIACIESDLHIQCDTAIPGKGRILDSLQSFLYAAPVTFHYLRYFT
jgi:phosphatidate cytidylyltransferase